MSNTIGELRLPILLDIAPMNESIKTALNLLKMFHTNANDALKLKPPTFSAGAFDSELNKLNDKLKSYQSGLKGASDESTRMGGAVKDNTVLTEKYSGALQNAFLRVEGFRSVLNLLKTTFGSMISDYEAQEIADQKLINNMRNVGESMESVNRLRKQAAEFQEITVYGDEQIEEGQAMLGTFKKSSEEIAVLTPRMLDLSAAFDASGQGGKGLIEVAVMLGKVNEETIGTLRRVGVAFSKEQEEKLKSLKGMEQTLYLADILDTNFKGLAETVGQTSAGQMAIFRNKVGEVSESLGGMLSETLMPTVVSLGEYTKIITSASPPVKILTIGVLGLGAAFVVLNTSMGATPYIVIGIITLVTSLNSIYTINTEKIKENKEEMLRNQDVSESMKRTLDGLEVSANNMADAYKGISDAIVGMTRTQLQSAKQFVEAEIAKIEAVRETAKVLRSQELRTLGLADYDISKRSKEEVDQFINWSEYGANLDKLNDLNTQIDAKMKFTPDTPGGDTKSGKSTTGNVREETDAVEEAIKSWDKLIEKHYSSVESLKATGKSELEIIREVSEAIVTSKLREAQLTDDQILKLDQYRKRLAESLDPSVVTKGGDDIRAQIEADVQAMREAYNERSKFGTDARFKPFDEVEAFRKALQLRKEITGEHITVADYLSLIEMSKEKINSLDASNYKDLEKIKTLTDDISKYNKAIDDNRKNGLKLANEEYRQRLEMVDDEFLRRRELTELAYREEVAALNEQINKTDSVYEKSILGQMKLNSLRKRDRELERIDSEELSHQAMTVLDSFSGALQNSQQIARLFGSAGDNIVDAFQRALNIANAIKTIMDTVSIVKSLLTLFSSGAAGAIPVFHSGGEIGGRLPAGDVLIRAQEGEGVIRRSRMSELKSMFGSGFFEWLNGGTLTASLAGVYHSGGVVSASAPGVASLIREVPYISTYTIEGKDFKHVLNRQDKLDVKRGVNN